MCLPQLFEVRQVLLELVIVNHKLYNAVLRPSAKRHEGLIPQVQAA
jgi:hypothetical protein